CCAQTSLYQGRSSFSISAFSNSYTHGDFTLTASKASISLLMVPVIGVLSGYLVLNESLNPATLGGIVCILAGVWLVHAQKPELRKKNTMVNFPAENDTL
ncbi:EamA family transporter, partial [Paenibacillus naphthalenovorans]|uniref:EamA family transporter n=1 Tax=Paenibacillus naphthalenovorans TaxID=162209 RepID=UPI0008801F32